MSIIKNNPLLKGASGMLGNVVVYREVRGKLVMSNRPKSSGSLSDKQLGVRNRFLAAVQYGKAQMADPVSKAMYESLMGDRYLSAYAAAVADFLKIPEIRLVDVSRYTGAVGGTIEVTALDDFKVVSVDVLITNSAGVQIETGQATQQAGNLNWSYLSTVNNPAVPGTIITVRAKDKPGNVVEKEVIIT